MDFSWVKDLAEQANVQESERRRIQRLERLKERQLSLATGPFVEKLYLLINACAEEFNKYIAFNHLKVTTTRVVKRTKGTLYPDDPELTYPEETAYFTFSRKDWTYGMRGSDGSIEFIEISITDGKSGLGARFDEVGATPSRKLVASIDDANDQVVWQLDGQNLGGQQIVNICTLYFREFIEKSNP